MEENSSSELFSHRNLSQMMSDCAEVEETSLLSEGATCHTYRVTIDGHTYFKKQLREEYLTNAMYHEAFQKEFSVGNVMVHPNLVKYTRLVDNDDECYMLMDYINGMTLKDKLATDGKYFKDMYNLDKFILQLLSGLGYIHSMRVVHLDLKPQNIMLTNVNNDVRIIDFGFCYADISSRTMGSSFAFSAPEQKAENVKVDARTDIYTVGKIVEYIQKETGMKLPQKYQHFIEKCTQEKPSNRYQTTEEAIRNLKRYTLIKRMKHAAIYSATFILLAGGISHAMGWDIMAKEYLERQFSKKYDFELDGICYSFFNKENNHTYVTVSECPENAALEGDINIPSFITYEGQRYRVLSISSNAFICDNNITSLTLGDSIELIGSEALRGCGFMKTIHLPKSLTHMTKAMLVGCKSLQEIRVPDEVTTIGYDCFGYCTSLKSVNLPFGLTTIERGAFWECTSLESISLLENVTNVGHYAFWGCKNLKDVWCYADNPPQALEVFDPENDITLHVHDYCIDKYKNAEGWKDLKIRAYEEDYPRIEK